MNAFSTKIRSAPNAAALAARAQRVIPGGISHDSRQQGAATVYVQRAQGARLWDLDENVYVDLWMAHYDAIFGHAPAFLLDALREVMTEGVHIGLPIEDEVLLAEAVLRLLPSAEQVRFCASGTEATMYAVRLARGFTKRNVVLKMVGGWHGANTDLLVDVRLPRFGEAESAGVPVELRRCTHSMELNDIEDAQRAFREAGDDLAAVIVEPVMGSLGFIPAEADYLRFLREETTRRGAVLIFDEIITGFRLGLAGAQGHYDVHPDLSTLGKVLGGGMPIGAIAGTERLLALSRSAPELPKAERVFIGGGTYSCNPLSMRAGRVTLARLEQEGANFYDSLAHKTESFCVGLEEIFHRLEIPVTVLRTGSLAEIHFTRERGMPVQNARTLLRHTDLARKREFYRKMRQRGVLLLHGMAISSAHSADDIAAILAAAECCAREIIA